MNPPNAHPHPHPHGWHTFSGWELELWLSSPMHIPCIWVVLIKAQGHIHTSQSVHAHIHIHTHSLTQALCTHEHAVALSRMWFALQLWTIWGFPGHKHRAQLLFYLFADWCSKIIIHPVISLGVFFFFFLMPQACFLFQNFSIVIIKMVMSHQTLRL